MMIPDKKTTLFGKVAVMLGGDSAEREVSLNSGHAALQALLNKGIDAHPFDPVERPITELLIEKFDRVLIMLHGRGGEDGSLQGALEQLNIPYSGSGVLGSALAMDKVHTKQIWQCLGLPTAKYKIVDKSGFNVGSCGAIMEALGNQVMVKPAREGSSIGMTKVTSAKQLETAVQQAFEYDRHALIEQFIDGAEYTVALVNRRVLPSIRMSTPHVFYDYAAKYQDNTTEYFCPSGLASEREQYLAALSLKAFDALSCSGWGRIDYMQDKFGEFYLLEANTVPGMTETSLVPKAASADGTTFEDLVVEILATSLEPVDK